MEKDYGSWFHHQHLQLLSRNLNSSSFQFDLGCLNTEPVYRIPYYVKCPTPRTRPILSFCGMQCSKVREPNGSHSPDSFFSCRHFHESSSNVLNSVSKENFPKDAFDFGQAESPVVDAPPEQKRFLVFDQSGDKTTLIYSSVVDTPIQCGTCLVPKSPTACNPIKEVPRLSLHPPRPIINDEHIECNSEDDTENEMHEDTEELNALLFSDSDNDFSEDDEETSTGHSPSTMIDNGSQNLVEETGEEADNYSGSTKRQKLLVGHYGVPAQRLIRSSSKTYQCSALEGEAESTCDIKQNRQELDSMSCRKRKERIQEKVGILQGLFPSLNGKDAIVVIDEAIHYLRSLKVKVNALKLEPV